jgi:hypothetical protein
MIARVKPLLVLSAATWAIAAIVGCGGDGSADEAEIPGGADPEEVRVIDEWSSALREGDVERAADYFTLPSIAQNGAPAVELRTREDAIAFNRALPCGAELIEAVPDGPFTVATFELTERPGAGKCGTGVGETAKTAFLIEDGSIARWIRAADDPVLDEPSAPVV